ncbi:MAG: cell division protein, partial [Corynebacterium urealyticum]
MALTPADVHNVAFSKPPIGKRGYNEDEVDQFLDLVEDTLAELQDENAELRSQVGDGSQPAAAAADTKVDEEALRKQIRSEVEAEVREEARREAQNTQSKGAAEVSGLQSKLKEAEQRAEAAERRAQEAEEKAKKAQQDAEAAKSQAGKAAPQASGVAGGAAAKGAATEDTHMQAARVLSLAQEMADRLTNDAKTESNAMLDEARAEAKKTLDNA